MNDDAEPLIETLARMSHTDLGMLSIEARPESTIFVHNVVANYGAMILNDGKTVDAAVIEVVGENVLGDPDAPAPHVELIFTPELFVCFVGYMADLYRELRDGGHFHPHSPEPS